MNTYADLLVELDNLVDMVNDAELVHTHRCGWLDEQEAVLTGLKPSDGCGHIWSHRERDLHTETDRANAHTCPKCGKGPWLLKWARDESKPEIRHPGSDVYKEVNGKPDYVPPYLG